MPTIKIDSNATNPRLRERFARRATTALGRLGADIRNVAILWREQSRADVYLGPYCLDRITADKGLAFAIVTVEVSSERDRDWRNQLLEMLRSAGVGIFDPAATFIRLIPVDRLDYALPHGIAITYLEKEQIDV